ncbi:uncharacterized protein [Periplaneta americana]|uniref:uncharacterized protein isoform X2 n=1 Tax=Periplaneta americana TaxID=6978 RepID=UPI0037E7920F
MFRINPTVVMSLLPMLLLATVFGSVLVEGREEDASSTRLSPGPYTQTVSTDLSTEPETTTDKVSISDSISVTEFKEVAPEPNSTIRSSINQTFTDLFESEKEETQLLETKLEVPYIDYGLEEAKQEPMFVEVAQVNSSMTALHSNINKTTQNTTEAENKNYDLIQTGYTAYDNVKPTTDKSKELNNNADEIRDINSTKQETMNSNEILVSEATNENLDISTVKPLGAAITVIQSETQNTFSNSSESLLLSTFNIDMTTVSSHSNKSSPSTEVTEATDIPITVQHQFNKSPESMNISTVQPEVATTTSLSNKSSNTEVKTTEAAIVTRNNFSKPTEPVQIYTTEADVERNISNTYFSTEAVVDEDESITTQSEPEKSSVTNVTSSSTEVAATTTYGINTFSETTHRNSTTNEALTTTSITASVRPLNKPNYADESSMNKETESSRDGSTTEQNNLQTYSPQYICIRPGRFPARPSCTEYHVCRRVGVWLFHFKERCHYGFEFSSRHRRCVPPHVSDCRKEFVFSYIHNRHNKEDESKSSESVNENSDEDSRSSHSEEEPRRNILAFLLKKKVKYE